MVGALGLAVRLFASVREAVGADRVSVELDDDARVGDLLAALAAQYPEVARQRASLSVAVNQRIARADQRLAPGDDVALIPPVGGG